MIQDYSQFSAAKVYGGEVADRVTFSADGAQARLAPGRQRRPVVRRRGPDAGRLRWR